MVDTAVIGARGYLGRELVRILDTHPRIDAILPVSLSGGGGAFGASVPAFAHRKDLHLVGKDDVGVQEADVVFLATAGGQAQEFVASLPADSGQTVIDLSRDHRIAALTRSASSEQVELTVGGGATTATASAGMPWVYGLPDTMLAPTAGDLRIANPGCYPTAALLSLLPAVAAGLAAPMPVIVDGKSGVSGGGATPRPDLHFTETNENLRAYKVLGHDHGVEMQAALARVNAARRGATQHASQPVRFTPHLVPMNRGLLATCYIPLAQDADAKEVRRAYEAAYAATPTVHVVDEPATANVVRTNRAEIAIDVDPETRIIVARAAIDNLVKGGSGQAVHNMNIALGLEPTLGLPLLGGGP